MTKRAMTGVAGLILCAGATHAAPITYTFTGVGDGSLGSQGFIAQPFEITLHADTDNIVFDELVPGTLFPRIIVDSATFNLPEFGGGIGASGEFLFDTSLIVNPLANAIVLGDFSNNQALAVVAEPGFAGYELGAPFGPVTTEEISATFQFVSKPTTAGFLALETWDVVTFQAIPTPGTAALLLAGGIAAARRRR